MKSLFFTLRRTTILAVVTLLLASCQGRSVASNGGGGGKSPEPTVESAKHAAIVARAIEEARTYTGTRYRMGGTSRQGIDCSALTMNSYAEAGVEIPRTSDAQSVIGRRVYIGELQPGDLVFFTDRAGNTKITHVGLVTEVTPQNVTFIHATTRRGVMENELLDGYYRPLYLKAVRPLE